MRHSAAALAVLCAASLPALLAPPAPAAFSGHFASLREFLDGVDSSAPDGTRDGRRRHRAAGRALGLLDRPADDLGDDLTTARRLARLLRSGWRGEERSTLAPPLDGLFDGALDGLHGGVLQDLQFLAASCGGLEPGTRDAVLACVDRGRALLEGAAGGTPAERLRTLFRVRREWERARRILAAAPLPERHIRATRDGVPVEFDEVLVSRSSVDGTLALSAVRAAPPVATLVAMAAEPVDGAGVFTLAMAGMDVAGTPLLSTESGTLEILAFDGAASTLSLRLTFLGEGPPGSGVAAEVVLEYEGPFFAGD